MADIFLGNIAAAILDPRGHQVQNGPLVAKGPNFRNIVQKFG